MTALHVLFAAIALTSAHRAQACQCIQHSNLASLHPSVTDHESVPGNIHFPIFESWPGLFDEDPVSLETTGRIPIPAEVRRFPQIDGSTMIEIFPQTPVPEGERLLLVDGDYVIADYAVTAPDHTPPEVLEFHVGARTSKDTSCGEHITVPMEIVTDGEPLANIRFLDKRTGQYWHGPLDWTDSCGGLRPEHFAGAKWFTVVDFAGNESEPIKFRAGPCGCTTQGGSGPATWLLTGLLLLAVFRR